MLRSNVIAATNEAYQNFISAGFSLSAIRPRVMAGATAKLSLLCDLTDKANRRRIRFTLEELLSEDWQGIQAAGEESWTQAIGRGCRTAGFEGLLVPSARNWDGTNIVVFPDKLLPGHHLTICRLRIYRLILTNGQNDLHLCRFYCLPNGRLSDSITVPLDRPLEIASMKTKAKEKPNVKLANANRRIRGLHGMGLIRSGDELRSNSRPA